MDIESIIRYRWWIIFGALTAVLLFKLFFISKRLQTNVPSVPYVLPFGKPIPSR
jgi:Na+/melibiose symporter-like transporter